MDSEYLEGLFGLSGKAVVVTGGGGVLCRAISLALARLGAKVAILNRGLAAAQKVTDEINSAGGRAIAIQCDVLDKAGLEASAQTILQSFGRVDILINGVGGNKQQATTSSELSFFDLPPDAIRWVFDLNCLGAILPSQVFGRLMAEQAEGCILNISSMNALRPLTRVPAYSAAKSAVGNFTQWLAVHLAQEYSPKIRVNAIAPGFFLTDQNRFLLIDQTHGDLTARGRAIITHTPLGRLGDPEDLIGATLWLLSPGASFVTGIVVPVDGGFSAYSGV